MTVIKKKQNYSFPTNSGNNSDVESLHLGSVSASDTESLNNDPIPTTRLFMPPILKNTKTEDLINLKRNSGRKKLRRCQNRCMLQTLAEQDEDDGTLVVIMESYRTPFTKLLQDNDALQFWNTFTEKSEEEQAEVIEAFSKRNQSCNNTPLKTKPFSRIFSKVRRTIKIRKNLSLEQVKKSEDDMIAFFKNTPNQIYIKWPSTYFERLLLHAIARYHCLQSLGLVEDGRRRIEVYNTTENWIPAECFLTDFIAQLRT